MRDETDDEERCGVVLHHRCHHACVATDDADRLDCGSIQLNVVCARAARAMSIEGVATLAGELALPTGELAELQSFVVQLLH